jgi:hypothetical protein
MRAMRVCVRARSFVKYGLGNMRSCTCLQLNVPKIEDGNNFGATALPWAQLADGAPAPTGADKPA